MEKLIRYRYVIILLLIILFSGLKNKKFLLLDNSIEIMSVVNPVLELVLKFVRIILVRVIENMEYYVGGFSLIFFFLNFVIFTLCYQYHYYNTQIQKKNRINFFFFLLEILIYVCIYTNNLLIFYIFFEMTLIVFFFLIYELGSRTRKIHATYMLIIYTLIGSIFLILAISLLLITYGTLEIREIECFLGTNKQQELIIFLLLFLGFAVKVPIFPLHLWLLEAHVEAHTTTSVVLASMILKLGGIGMVKFMLPLSSSIVGTIYYYIIIGVVTIGLIVCGFSILQQLDLKRIIAYSSILHMNFSIISLLTFVEEGIKGAIISMFAHGLTAAGLFFCVGMLYERYGTRNALLYKGIAEIHPKLATLFFISLLTNSSFPFSINFIGELNSFFGIQCKSMLFNILLVIVISSTVLISFWLGARLFFGAKIETIASIEKYSDLVPYEEVILISLILINVLFGTFLTDILFELLK